MWNESIFHIFLSYHNSESEIKDFIVDKKKHEATCIEFTNTSFQNYKLEMIKKRILFQIQDLSLVLLCPNISVSLCSVQSLFTFEWMNLINHIYVYIYIINTYMCHPLCQLWLSFRRSSWIIHPVKFKTYAVYKKYYSVKLIQGRKG